MHSALAALTLQWRRDEATRRATEKILKNEDEERRDPTEVEVEAELDSVPDYPELLISKDMFNKCFCKCIKERRSTKCDCTICSHMSFNFERFHVARKKWGVCESNEKCPCHNDNYQKASRSVNFMAKFTM